MFARGTSWADWLLLLLALVVLAVLIGLVLGILLGLLMSRHMSPLTLSLFLLALGGGLMAWPFFVVAAPPDEYDVYDVPPHTFDER